MYKITVPPTAEPISLTDAKNHLKVDYDDDDALIEVIITAVREYVEIYVGRALMPQTIQEYFDTFPCVTDHNPRAGIEARFAPLQSLTYLKYIDTGGGTITLTADTDYYFDNISEPPRIFPAFGKTWPTVRNQPNAMWFEYIAGYTQASDVPAIIKQAMLIMIAKMYEQREDSVKNLPTVAENYLNKVRIRYM